VPGVVIGGNRAERMICAPAQFSAQRLPWSSPKSAGRVVTRIVVGQAATRMPCAIQVLEQVYCAMHHCYGSAARSGPIASSI
jgi:hypothetical protein